MGRWVFFLLAFGICEVFSLSTSAAWKSDYRFEGFSRSNPVGGYLRAEGGLAHKMWGFNNNDNPLYGMVRFMGQAQTSGLVNSVRAQAEIYPISFLGLYVAKSFMRRDLEDLDNFDCNLQTTCDTNELTRDFWGVKLALKVKSFYLMSRTQWHTTQIKDNIRGQFADEQGTLLGSGSKDVLLQSINILGYQWDSVQSAGVLHKRNFMRNTRQDSTMSVLFYRRQFQWRENEENKPWALMIGPGIFHTRQNTNHPMIFALLQYRPKMGLTLF